MTDNITPANEPANENEAEVPKKKLSAAAERALEEAQRRRQAQESQKPAIEYGGRGGEDPSRFGDWEIDGRAIDF